MHPSKLCELTNDLFLIRLKEQISKNQGPCL